MERVSKGVSKLDVRSYTMLTKPGIIFGNVVTMAGGFALAAKGEYDLFLFLATLLGISLIIASSCVFNNTIDRKADQKMERTKHRPLVTGKISPRAALVFSLFLGVMGLALLFIYVNPLTAILAFAGFFVYVVPYSFLKYHTVHGTLIGSIAGALPPVIGYTAVTNALDLGAGLFFLIVVLWQMPHFFAIALYRIEDYKAAHIPVLPVKKGIEATKIQMLIYVIAFTGASSLLTILGYTSDAFLALMIVLGALWVILSLKGFRAQNVKKWAREMFVFSLFVIMAECIAIPFTVVL